jgi:hypothetical protein
MNPRLNLDLTPANFSIDSRNKMERQSGRNHRRRNHFQPLCEQVDSRVLLSTFDGNSRPASATIGIVGHQPMQSQSAQHDLKLAGMSGSGRVSAPSAPTSFRATAASTTQINLSWGRVSGATGYLVDEWMSGAWRPIAKLSSRSMGVAVTSLQPGTTYCFDVGSYNSAGTRWASYKSATTRSMRLAPPPAPSLTATAVSDSEIDLAWTGVSRATGYDVDEWENGAWILLTSLSSSTTSYAVTGLSANTSYNFIVGAFNAAGTTWASQQSATTFDDAPAAPSFIATAVSSTEIDLAWSSVSDATDYPVFEFENDTWVQIADPASDTTFFAVTGLSASTTYFFMVGGNNAAGANFADYQSATTFDPAVTPPAAPAINLTVASSSEIDVTWTGVDGATGYTINESEDGSTWTQVGNVDGNTTSFAATGLSANTTYYFQVGASNDAGTTWSSTQSATTMLDVALNNPTANVAYSTVNGTLFGTNGPSYLDVQQGQVGDCWLMASLAEVAARAPSDIVSMFTYEGTAVENGSDVQIYSVRFFDNSGTAQYVTVDTELPGGGTYYDQPVNGVLWPALAEKAYAEANGLGYVNTSNPNTNSYAAMNNGQASWALRAITGNASGGNALSTAGMPDEWNNGSLLVITTNTPASSFIVGDHAYAVVGYDSSSGNFEVFNPWGTTANGRTPSDPNVYGLFPADSQLLSDNFVYEFQGTGAANLPATAASAHGTVSPQVVDLLFALDPQWFTHRD